MNTPFFGRYLASRTAFVKRPFDLRLWPKKGGHAMRKIDRYLEALQELQAIERALVDEGHRAEHLIAALGQAKAQATVLYGRLTGREIGELRRRTRAL